MSQLLKDFSIKLKAAIPTATVRPALGKDRTFPAAIYSVRNGMRDLFYVGSFGLRSTEFTVTIYTKTYDELQTLKEAVVSGFHGFSGVMGTSSTSKIAVTNILDGYEDDLETLHRSTIVIEVHD